MTLFSLHMWCIVMVASCVCLIRVVSAIKEARCQACVRCRRKGSWTQYTNVLDGFSMMIHQQQESVDWPPLDGHHQQQHKLQRHLLRLPRSTMPLPQNAIIQRTNREIKQKANKDNHGYYISCCKSQYHVDGTVNQSISRTRRYRIKTTETLMRTWTLLVTLDLAFNSLADEISMSL